MPFENLKIDYNLVEIVILRIKRISFEFQNSRSFISCCIVFLLIDWVCIRFDSTSPTNPILLIKFLIFYFIFYFKKFQLIFCNFEYKIVVC